MRAQGLRCEVQRYSSVRLDHRAPRGSEDVPPGPPDGYPPQRTATVSQLGWGPDFLAPAVTGCWRPIRAIPLPPDAHGRGGRNVLCHASGILRWTAVHTSAPAARVDWSPSRMSLSTGLGRRAVRTSSPCPRCSPSPSLSFSSRTSGPRLQAGPPPSRQSRAGLRQARVGGQGTPPQHCHPSPNGARCPTIAPRYQAPLVATRTGTSQPP